MENGEIWLTELPQVDGHEQEGTRPVIVLAEVSEIAILIPLTSVLVAQRFPFTISINPTRRNGLRSESVALVFQIRAIDKRRITRKIGILEDSYIKKINELLKQMLKI